MLWFNSVSFLLQQPNIKTAHTQIYRLTICCIFYFLSNNLLHRKESNISNLIIKEEDKSYILVKIHD